MKRIAIFIVVLTLAIGTYLNIKQNKGDSQVMIEDTVESSMAAPIKPDIPF